MLDAVVLRTDQSGSSRMSLFNRSRAARLPIPEVSRLLKEDPTSGGSAQKGLAATLAR